jgi:SAM-dependent methyltransferase
MSTTMAMENFKNWLGANRTQIEYDLPTITERRYFSPLFYGQYQVIVPLLHQYARGKLIDLGCGVMPFRSILPDWIERYHALDIFPRAAGLTLIGDIQHLGMIPSAFYDSALCLEVLEHVPDPWQACREICRILKPGGVLILSVPHLSRLHDLPHDYYRYTHVGLTHMLRSAGLELVVIKTKGGLFTFLAISFPPCC